MLTLNNLEKAGLFTRKEGSKNYSSIRNKLRLVADVSGEDTNEMGLIINLCFYSIDILQVVIHLFQFV